MATPAPPQTDPLQLLTAQEVASLLRLTPLTVYQWARRGELPCVRIAGQVRFERLTILRWIEARREG